MKDKSELNFFLDSLEQKPQSPIYKEVNLRFASCLGTLHSVISDLIVEEDNKNFHPWFRGVTDEKFNLSPKLYRRIEEYQTNVTGNNFWEKLRNKEKELTIDFKCRAFHKIDKLYIPNSYMALSVMQHYGLPTRLLDFSESFLTAIFFALEKYIQDPFKRVDSLPCIWVLYPDKFKFQEDENEKKVPEKYKSVQRLNNLVDNPKELSNGIVDDQFILSIAPYHNERIQSQQGCFVIFPNDDKPDSNYSQLYLDKHESAGCYLTKIIITDPNKIALSLIHEGMKSSLFYPEIDHICKELDMLSFTNNMK